MIDLRVDGQRLWSRLMEMAKVGATPAGGCNRQALTDEDRAGRELFRCWCEKAGYEVRLDTIGNLFAQRPGRIDHAPAVLTGSHLDTQPTGGRFDGVYGVLAGLEVLDTLNDHGVETEHPLEVAVWTNEEGSRFDMAMMGSAVWSGAMPLEDAYALADRSGATVREELERTGQLGPLPATPGPIKAAFEIHIEQGPILEQAGKLIGVVTGVQHMSRHRVVIGGQEAHAGTTPMDARRDPVKALSILLPKLYGMAEAHGPDARLTFGFLDARPGSSNTVPGELELTVDLRHPRQACYEAMVAGLGVEVERACTFFDLASRTERFFESAGLQFDEQCIAAVRTAVTTTGYESLELISGAGHDACNVATVAPTSMIFIPCDGGLSHNEAENTSPEHVEAGANVLLHAMLQMARA